MAELQSDMWEDKYAHFHHRLGTEKLSDPEAQGIFDSLYLEGGDHDFQMINKEDNWTSVRAPRHVGVRGGSDAVDQRKSGVEVVGVLPRDPPWLMKADSTLRAEMKLPIHVNYLVLHWATLLEGCKAAYYADVDRTNKGRAEVCAQDLQECEVVQERPSRRRPGLLHHARKQAERPEHEDHLSREDENDKNHREGLGCPSHGHGVVDWLSWPRRDGQAQIYFHHGVVGYVQELLNHCNILQGGLQDCGDGRRLHGHERMGDPREPCHE